VPRLRAHNIAVSLDGFMAGPDQTLEHPMGVGGMRLHEWAFAARSFGGAGDGLDEAFIQRGDEGVGATVMGRNMFGPVRGPWPDERWTGWWGDEPPYHHAVFVLTHHPRDPLEMQGGTTFYFVTDGLEVALERAFAAADGADVRVGGGADMIRQCLRAGLLDELHLAVAPVLLGRGERLLDDLGDAGAGYTCAELVSSDAVAHVRLVRG
jgi:dihydrofolate reductase